MFTGRASGCGNEIIHVCNAVDMTSTDGSLFSYKSAWVKQWDAYIATAGEFTEELTVEICRCLFHTANTTITTAIRCSQCWLYSARFHDKTMAVQPQIFTVRE